MNEQQLVKNIIGDIEFYMSQMKNLDRKKMEDCIARYHVKNTEIYPDINELFSETFQVTRVYIGLNTYRIICENMTVTMNWDYIPYKSKLFGDIMFIKMTYSISLD
jgi:hypothetical protein